MNHETDMMGNPTSSGPTSDKQDYASSAKSAARDAMHGAREAMDETKEQFSGAYERARETAAEASDTIGNAMMDLMDRRRADLAQGFNEVAEALYRASEDTGEQAVPRRFVELTADTFGSVAQIIEERSSRDMVRSITEFGRANPATFVVTTLLAGFAVGRLLTAEDPSRRDDEVGYGRDRFSRDDDDMGSDFASQRAAGGSGQMAGSTTDAMKPGSGTAPGDTTSGSATSGAASSGTTFGQTMED
jgi:hypothetical protein